MKLALVLTGLSRMWWEAYPKLKENFITNYDTDVFINIWTEKGYYSGKGYGPIDSGGYVSVIKDSKGFHNSGELTDFNDMIETYKPVSVRIDDFSRYEAMIENKVVNFTKAYTNAKNTAAQAWMAYRGLELMNNYTLVTNSPKYDLVIRARPDMVLREVITPLPLDTMITFPYTNKMNKGTGDGMQIGNHDQSMIFGEMWNNLELIYNICGVSCPHMFAEQWILYNKLPWKQMYAGAYYAHSPKGAYQEPD
jgi:hypothetical protein